MAKQPRSKRRKLVIEGFRGVHDQPPAKSSNAYTRRMMGLYDNLGGNLSRLYGCISATSTPHGSVWSLAQLRFRDNMGLVVQDTSNRLWYDHNRDAGIYDGLLPFPSVAEPDWEVAETPPEGTSPYEPPFEPGDEVDECQSWWDWRYGRWREADIADCQIYCGIQGTYGSWLTAATGGTCRGVGTEALGYVTSDVPTGWSSWALGPGGFLAWIPEVASQVTLSAWNWGADPRNAQAAYQELRWTIKSATLAATNPYTYTGVYIRFGTMELMLRGGLGSLIGNSWWAETPTANNRSAGMIFYDVSRSQIVSQILGTGWTCPPSPPVYQERFHLSTGTNAAVPDEAWFFNEGYRFTEHDSCFEG